MGCKGLERDVRALAPRVHVFGHSHIDVDEVVGGTRFVQRAIGHPSDRCNCVGGVDRSFAKLRATSAPRATPIMVWATPRHGVKDPHLRTSMHVAATGNAYVT